MPVAALPEVAAVAEGGAAEGAASSEGGGILSRFRRPFMGGGGRKASAPGPSIEGGGKYTSEMLSPHQFSQF